MPKLYTNFLVLLFLISGVLPLTGQAQRIGWSFATASPDTNVANVSVSAITQNNNLGTTTLLSTPSSSSTSTGNYPGASGGNNAGMAVDTGAFAVPVTGTAYFEFTLTPAAGASITVTEMDFGIRSTSTGPRTYDLRSSLDGFAAIDSFTMLANSSWSYTKNSVSFVGAADQPITIRIYGYDGHGNRSPSTANWRMDDLGLAVTVTGGGTGPLPPTLSATPTALSGFVTPTGTASAAQKTIINGSNLTRSATVQAPAGFEVSTDSITFVPIVVLNQTGGSINAPVFARISAGTTPGIVSGNLVAISTDDTVRVAAKGNVDPIGVPARVVINQVYGGGGNSGATYTHDFVELFNNDDTAVNLSGWSVQYGSATVNSTWTGPTPLHGTIPAHGFFLIREGNGAGGTTPLPSPDILTTGSDSISMAATAGKVILCYTDSKQTLSNPTGPQIVDKVGYGTAVVFETAAAPAPSNTTADRRKVDGADTDNNSTDFVTDSPIPRNSTYTTSPPNARTFTPVRGATNVPYNSTLSLIFDKAMVKRAGQITIIDNTTSTSAAIDINSPRIIISNKTSVTIDTILAGGKSYSIEISAGALQDVYGNGFAGLLTTSDWTFTTFDNSVATLLPAIFNFQTCTGTGLLPNGFTQFSISGAQVWDCTAFGRDSTKPDSPSLSAPNGIQINGFANGINNRNVDWLVSPKLNITGTNFPLLSFWSRNAFAGDPLQLKISTDYTGTGDPTLATWTDLNGKFPSQGSDIWVRSSNINLAAYKNTSVYIAWVYTSSTDDGSRWTLDDIRIDTSTTPPPPSLTFSTNDFSFGFAAAGSSVTKKLTVTGNDLVQNITLSSGGAFLISTDSVHFTTTAVLGKDTANNVAEPIFIRFSPATSNNLFFDSVTVQTSDTTAFVSLKGNSVDPASTLSIVNWNLNWFGTPDNTLGVADKTLQEQNVGIILPSIHADLYALQEVVNDSAMRAIVATMPGYGYVINNYGSHSNTTESSPDPLTEVQKLAFIYNTSKISNIQTDSLLSIGVNTAPDTHTVDYNDWASGRFPYMLTADVTLSDNNGGTIVKKIHFINIHAKANTAPVDTAYLRREHGAHRLDSLIRTDYVNNIDNDHNVIVLGDFNDDLNHTITTGKTVTSYHAFTSAAEDSALYIFPTRPLSAAGQNSDVNFSNSVIDNMVATKALSSYYLPSSATILTEVAGLVNKYGTTTTDHYPLFTQFSFSPPTPLPVKLTTFTGVRQGSQVRLDWTTSQESNSKEFHVERSSDGAHFVSIGVVAAQGTSHTPTHYTFYDDQPLAGNNFYRLDQLDLDEKSDYSKVIKLNITTTLTVGPNPAHGTVYITLSNVGGAAALSILDVNGRVVLQQSVLAGTVRHPIDVSRLAAGIYTVKIVNDTGVQTEKLLVR